MNWNDLSQIKLNSGSFLLKIGLNFWSVYSIQMNIQLTIKFSSIFIDFNSIFIDLIWWKQVGSVTLSCKMIGEYADRYQPGKSIN